MAKKTITHHTHHGASSRSSKKPQTKPRSPSGCIRIFCAVATILLERGMPLEQIQKFLGHSKLETIHIYAESTPEMIKASYQKALVQ